MKLLERLARAMAVLAGLMIVGITLMTCVSLIGRNAVGKTIVGDIELTASAAGAAIAMFLPWCQVRRGHIIVDFFTAKATVGTQAGLDQMAAWVTAIVLGAMAWRTTLGGINAWTSQESSMMLGFPNWIVYGLMVPGLALAAVIAAAQGMRRQTTEASSP